MKSLRERRCPGKRSTAVSEFGLPHFPDFSHCENAVAPGFLHSTFVLFDIDQAIANRDSKARKT